MRDPQSWVFTAQCPSAIGTVDVCTHFMAQRGLYVDQHQSFDDRIAEQFFIRIAFHPQEEGFSADEFNRAFKTFAARYDMTWTLTPPDKRPKVAILVSKYDHCLNDLLYRHRTGQLNIDIPLIISNHPDLKSLADAHDIPYYHLPITKETKPEQEAQIKELLIKYEVELVVLARYMQVMSPAMCEFLDGWAINIHTLLPGFKGAKPYHQAWEKGVKLVVPRRTTSTMTWTRARSLPRASGTLTTTPILKTWCVKARMLSESSWPEPYRCILKTACSCQDSGRLCCRTDRVHRRL